MEVSIVNSISVNQFGQQTPVDRFVGLTAEEAAERRGFEFEKQDEEHGHYWVE